MTENMSMSMSSFRFLGNYKELFSIDSNMLMLTCSFSQSCLLQINVCVLANSSFKIHSDLCSYVMHITLTVFYCCKCLKCCTEEYLVIIKLTLEIDPKSNQLLLGMHVAQINIFF